VGAKRQGAPVPQSLEDFFQKALAREKEDRFQSAQEFVDAMLDAVDGLSDEQLDALPTNSVADAGSGSKPSQRSVSKPDRSSSSNSRARSPAPAGRTGGSQPSAARAGGSHPSAARSGQPAPRGSQPSSPSAARAGSGAASGVRPATPAPRPGAAPTQQTESLVEETLLSGRKIALVAIPLALIAAGGAFVALRPSTPAQPPPAVVEVKKAPAPEPQQPAEPAVDNMILVQVRSSPPGASVFDGDTQIGTTPFARKLRRNELHELTFQLSEHQVLKHKLDFSGVVADSQDVSVALEPVKAAPTEPSSRPSRPAKQGKDKDDSVPIFE
jgi:serine/threonine-protein kinase